MRKVKLINLDTNEEKVYKSIQECADDLCYSQSYISAIIKMYKTLDNKKIIFYGENKNDIKRD